MTIDQPAEAAKPKRVAAEFTRMLDLVHGQDRYPVDVEALLLEVSRQRFPNDPVLTIESDDLPGFEGALLPIGKPIRRGWGVLYNNRGNTPGRRRFTVAHEAGHYFLHRHGRPKGFRCDERAISRRDGAGIEKEADTFAAALLMPFHDLRLQLPADEAPTVDKLSRLADRYGVSLTAVTLRWLEYTERRSLIVVSRDGSAEWAKASDAAYRSGRFIKSSSPPFEIPTQSLAGTGQFDLGSTAGKAFPPGVWFGEETFEYSVTSARFERTITILHLGKSRAEPSLEEDRVADVFDFISDRSRGSP